ncbi:MAG: hypothetical protein AB7V22_03730 [Kiritimatiellia bacterium]
MTAWGLATAGLAANLGAWALTADGTGTTEEPGKVTVGNFVGGSGVSVITYGTSGGYANQWTTGSTVDANDYFEVSVAPQTGYGLVISGIDYSERRSSTGIREFQVRVSTNNFASYAVLATNAVPDNDSERTYSIADLSLSVAEGQTFKLRFYGYSAEGSGGNWRINDNSLKIVGTAMSLTGPPVFSFSPGSGVQVHVSNTLEVAVSILPSGTVTRWWVDPTPAGTTNYAGGIFSYTPFAADFGGTNRLYMVASNAYGVSTGTLDIAVTEYLPPGTVEITFENAGEVKTSYDLGAVVLSGETWIMDQARIGDSALDLKIGARAACFGSYYPASMTSSNKLMPAGIGSISFLYAQYAGDDSAEALVVEVAADLEAGDWLNVGRVDPNGVSELTQFTTVVNIKQPMYVRIRTDYVPGLGRANFDNIVITPYAAPSYSAYEQYLLQYNVTPGDAGTAPGEDWDGDGASNTNEFTAGSNPYDPASVP